MVFFRVGVAHAAQRTERSSLRGGRPVDTEAIRRLVNHFDAIWIGGGAIIFLTEQDLALAVDTHDVRIPFPCRSHVLVVM
jgi:hypothetical protein